MNKRLVLVVVLVLGSAIAGALAVRSFARPAAAQLDVLKDATHLQQALGLTEAQVADVRKLQDDYGVQLEDCCSKHCAARAELGKALFDGADDEQMRGIVEKMCKARLESDLATVQHIRKVHNVLMPEQQTKYEEMVTVCVCGGCPSGFRHAKSGH
ncbi:MAG: Spy/CpxP family protein refolding chaperone [bacterium]